MFQPPEPTPTVAAAERAWVLMNGRHPEHLAFAVAWLEPADLEAFVHLLNVIRVHAP